MKKLVILPLLLLAICMLAAVESEPSNVVGYFKMTISEGGWQAITLPFAYSDLGLDSIFSDQFDDEDIVQEINEALASQYIDGYGWFGDLDEMVYGGAYNVNRTIGNGPLTYYILGNLDPQPFTITFDGNGGWTAFGLNEAAPVELTEDFFGLNTTDSDTIQDFNTGASSVFIEGYGWFGDIDYLLPTNVYNYNVIEGATGFTWTYSPSRTVPISAPFKTKSN